MCHTVVDYGLGNTCDAATRRFRLATSVASALVTPSAAAARIFADEISDGIVLAAAILEVFAAVCAVQRIISRGRVRSRRSTWWRARPSEAATARVYRRRLFFGRRSRRSALTFARRRRSGSTRARTSRRLARGYVSRGVESRGDHPGMAGIVRGAPAFGERRRLRRGRRVREAFPERRADAVEDRRAGGERSQGESERAGGAARGQQRSNLSAAARTVHAKDGDGGTPA